MTFNMLADRVVGEVIDDLPRIELPMLNAYGALGLNLEVVIDTAFNGTLFAGEHVVARLAALGLVSSVVGNYPGTVHTPNGNNGSLPFVRTRHQWYSMPASNLIVFQPGAPGPTDQFGNDIILFGARTLQNQTLNIDYQDGEVLITPLKLASQYA